MNKQYQNIENWITEPISEESTCTVDNSDHRLERTRATPPPIGICPNPTKLTAPAPTENQHISDASWSGSGSDIETDLKKKFEQLALEKLEQRNYGKAEIFLPKLINDEANEKAGEEHSSIKLKIAATCCFQGRWREAEAFVISLAMGKEQVDATALHMLHTLAVYTIQQQPEKIAYEWYDVIQEANNQGWIKKPIEPEVQMGVRLRNSSSNAYNGKWIIWADVNGTYNLRGLSLDHRAHYSTSGDGRDDYLAVQQDGSVHAAIFDESGISVHVVKDLAGGIRGQSGDQVRFADIDGDGYADYIVQSDDGAATVSINTKNVGNDDGKRNFEEAVVIAKGVDGVSGDKIQYADINGDGRADYLIVYDGGAVTA
ncbi:hypothetical protein FQN52_002265 [Onygenales sp. PD_12]|nr:hypothetical protein FQN52_002265 [Onygenales sp. PD_12]